MRDETLILGLGNALRGDDGAGPAVAGWLRAHGLPPGVTAVDGVVGLDLVTTLAGFRRAIIVDAAQMGRAPGEWGRFVRRGRFVNCPYRPDAMALHAAGLDDALALSAALGVLPEEVILFGIQPARLDWEPGLSAEAQAAVPAVGGAVLREIEGRDVENPDH